MPNFIQSARLRVVNTLRSVYRWVMRQIELAPLRTFFGFLLLLLILILINNFLTRPKTDEKKAAAQPKTVRTYHIGTAPTVLMQAQVEKENVITISALAPGIVQEINVQEGQEVGQGANLIWLSSNYQGSNIFSYQRQLAATQYKNATDTYDLQKDLINKQREVAQKSDINTEELRKITEQSLADLRTQININESIIDNLEDTIKTNEDLNTDEGDALAMQTKQIQSQVLAGLSQARNALRQTEYQVDVDNPPTQLAGLQKDIALKQLDLQQKMLDVGVEVSRIQLLLAQANENLMHPVAPTAGTVERIHVRFGQQVNPGEPLVTFSANSIQTHAVLYVPQTVAAKVSQVEPSKLFINQRVYESVPYFVSREAVQGTLYMIKYALPVEHSNSVADKSFVNVELPLGYADTTAALPFIPLDAVYQSKQEAYIYVIQKDTVKAKPVQLGTVYGEFVQVQKGIGSGDAVIVDRTVIEGEKVKPTRVQ